MRESCRPPRIRGLAAALFCISAWGGLVAAVTVM